MKIYRAMSEEELERTVKKGKPDFMRRFKWFSPNIEWVKNRVQDGKFNNSNHIDTRYIHLVEFEWLSGQEDFQSMNEIQFDRRKNPTIKYIKTME